jgi:hypothetical protein
MINLIPQTAKRTVAKEYWFRVISAWLFVFSFVLFIIACLLIPTYATITSQISAYEESAEAALAEMNRYTLSSATLIEASKQASLILKMSDRPNYTALIKKFEGMQNEGVSFTRIAIDVNEDGSLRPITISGKADTRSSLATFRSTLLSDPTIEDVLLPISNLAQEKDITFLITINLKPGEAAN